jgi:cardiolipin synthase
MFVPHQQPPIDGMKIDLRHARPIADLLTISRFLLGVILVILGFTHAEEGLSLAVILVLLSWLTDILDGRLAGRDPDKNITWVGRHDAEADLATSLGLAAYLVLSGFMAPWLGVVVAIILPGLWILHSHQLAWPIYAVPYVFLLYFAFRDAPKFGWLMVAYLLVTIVIQFPRLSGEHLPEFFQSLDSLRRNDR